VSACAPRVTLETVVPEVIETPTTIRRFGFTPTVWLQDNVVAAVDVNALLGGSDATAGTSGRAGRIGARPGRAPPPTGTGRALPESWPAAGAVSAAAIAKRPATIEGDRSGMRRRTRCGVDPVRRVGEGIGKFQEFEVLSQQVSARSRGFNRILRFACVA
jgi:hypothetical protein